VSLRTLYRYYPTKESLVDAASHTFSDEAIAAIGGSITVDNLAEYLRFTWLQFSASLDAVKAQHVTPVGREVRAARLPRSRAAVRAAVIDARVELGEDDLARLVDLIVFLTSSSTYLELVDRLGSSEPDAAKLAAWAVDAVITRARNEGAVAP
jgi:AcrR family transcriptional regulator